MSRTKNTLYNTIWSFGYEIFIFVFGLIVPRLIVLTYGSEVYGLTATISQVIAILTLLQAGAVGASIFAMYKPVADKNYKQASIILDSSKKYFTKLGYIFLVGILAIAPLVAFSKSSDTISQLEILLSVGVLGINASYAFFFISWYDILFMSHQKRYILSISSIVERSVYYILLFVIIHFKLHFTYMYMALLVGGGIRIIVLHILYKKQYGDLITKVKENNYKVPNKGYLLASTISLQAIRISPILIITSFFSLNVVSVFAIYSIIQNSVHMIINTIHLAVSPVFGNLSVSEDKNKVSEVFSVMQTVFFVVGTFMGTCMASLFMPFISQYTEGFTDANYSVPLLALMMTFTTLAFSIYLPYALFSNIYGYYKETYKQDITFAIIGVGLSIIAVKFFGIPAALTGLICYYVACTIYRLFIIKKNANWVKLGKLPIRTLLMAVLTILAFYLQQTYLNSIDSWLEWIALAAITVIITAIIILTYLFIFERENMKSSYAYLCKFVKK